MLVKLTKINLKLLQFYGILEKSSNVDGKLLLLGIKIMSTWWAKAKYYTTDLEEFIVYNLTTNKNYKGKHFNSSW